MHDISYDGDDRVTSSQVKTIRLLEGDVGATGYVAGVSADGVVELWLGSRTVVEVQPDGGWHPAGTHTPAPIFP